MADQTAAKEVTETAKEVAKEATAVASAAPKTAEAKPEPAKAKAEPAAEQPKAKAAVAAPQVRKQPARKPAAKRVKAAKPARKPAVAKARPAAKPARKTQPVRAGAKIEGAIIMNKQTKQNVETGLFAADQINNVFGNVNERAKAAAERSAKIAEEMADLTRGNVEALVASSKIAAKGVEALSQDAAEYSRKAFEEASATLKSFAEVKSATDFFRLQSDFARSAFDSAVAESARMSETVMKLAGEVAEPITSRYTVAAERVKTLAA
jgi:phasin family protein